MDSRPVRAHRSLLGAFLALSCGLGCAGPDSIAPTWSERVHAIESEPMPDPLIVVTESPPETPPPEPDPALEALESIKAQLEVLVEAHQPGPELRASDAAKQAEQRERDRELVQGMRTLSSVFCVIGGGVLIALGVLAYRLNQRKPIGVIP